MANSTQIITDLGTAATNGASATTIANAISPSNPAAATTNVTANGSGKYASGTYFGGILDYPGSLQLAILKAQELAVLLTRVLADTDNGSDGTNNALIAKCLNDLQ